MRYGRGRRCDERLPRDDANVPATDRVRARPRNLVVPLNSGTRGDDLAAIAKLRGVGRMDLPMRGYRRRIGVYALRSG